MREFKGVTEVAQRFVHAIKVFRDQNGSDLTRQLVLEELAMADSAYAFAERRVRGLPRSEFNAAVALAAASAHVLMFASGDEMALPDEDDLYVPEGADYDDEEPVWSLGRGQND
jgi:hypothetical protein